ncbi:glutathione hydrolase-like YwrD proenzyme [Dermacentor silvarum]|uniref:glutathione hydrolase-like YwrD proenzyme n=1 Tax=Dermacentor silvarum TaxID=543639 RepID=UPI002101311E|nr:glutathione hydrolase-like YwrD proenzyme [Dermacentor silvarum]
MAFLSYRSVRRMTTRFPTITPKAAVVSDEMLASVAGLDVLRRGGNAADAALAMAACMQVLQPYATGIGGDCFALHYDARTKNVRCIDGCGRSPAALTLEMVESKSRYDWTSERGMYGLQATVPGAAKAWFHIGNRFGSGKKLSEDDKIANILKDIADDVFNLLVFTNVTTVDSVIKEFRRLEQTKCQRISPQIDRLPNTPVTSSCELNISELLAPAINYAENGFPMDHVKHGTWRAMHNRLTRLPGGRYFLNEGNTVPPLGQILANRPLAALLKRLGQERPQVIYKGRVAEGIVEAVRCAGGVLSTEDLSDHLESTEPLETEPASTTYREVAVHTTTLPTQGAVLLEALNILNSFDLKVPSAMPEYGPSVARWMLGRWHGATYWEALGAAYWCEMHL